MKRTRSRSRNKAPSTPAQGSKYAKDLARLQAVGLVPKDKTPSRSTVARITSKNADDLDRSKTHFVRVPKGKRGKAAIEKAESLGLKTTPKGIFFEKDAKGERARVAVSKTGKTKIVVESKATSQKTGRTTTRKKVVPISGPEELLKQEARLRKEAAALGPLKRGEHLTFRVKEKTREGYSRHHYQSVEDIIRTITQYEKRANLDTPTKRKIWKNYFFRQVEVIKTTRAEETARDRIKRERRNAKRRR